MKKFICNICNYQTDIKCNYSKHCESKRHQKNLEKNQNESLKNQNESLKNQNESLKNQIFKCKYCEYNTKWKSNLNRHINKCTNRTNLEKIIENQKEEINTLKHKTEENSKVIENQKEEINTLTNELNDALKLVQEYQLKVKDTEIRCLKEMKQINISSNNNNNNRTNITQYIINKYPNAKNVWVPDKVSGLENYASDKVEENINKLLTNIYKRNIKP